MRDWKLILAAGAALILVGCTAAPTAPQLSSAHGKRANDSDCESRTGYFVRAGRSYSDSACLVEIPN